jgi:hypothetical protein
MALLDQCSWAYSDPTQVVQGQIFSFAVAVPPLVPTVGLVGTVLDTATAATIAWQLTDTTTSKPLIPGDDYQIVSGGINQMNLAFVVNPSRATKFNVQPVLSVAGGGPQVVSTGAAAWAPITYTPIARSTPELQTEAADLLKVALQLTASADLVEPGASVTLQVVQAAMTSTPQVVTNLVHELPDIKIRGAIPLGALVQAIIGPIVGAVSSALPSASDPLSGVEGQVASLLAEPLPIPLAFEVGGRRVTRTLAPLTTDLVTTVTSAPGDAQNLVGTVPTDRFLADFTLTPGVNATWTVSDENGQQITTSLNLSPGLNLVQTLLLLPEVVALGSPAAKLLPVPFKVTVHLQFDVPQLGLTGSNAVQLDVGPVTLLRLPFVLPQIAAVFQNAFDDWHGRSGQAALLSTDSVGARLMPSLDSMIRLLSTLSSVLDTFGKAAFDIGMDTAQGWKDLLVLGEGVRQLVTLLGRLPQDKIFFQPAYETDKPLVTDAVNDSTLLTGDWDDSISAAIHIGVPATKQTGGRFFRLADGNGPAFIDFNGPDAPIRAFVSIVNNLNQRFQDIRQMPPQTATSNHSGDNLNDILELLEFRD